MTKLNGSDFWPRLMSQAQSRNSKLVNC